MDVRSGALTHSYGTTKYVDVILSVPATWSTSSGVGDAVAGIKRRFMDNAASSNALSIELQLPSGKVGKGLGSGKTGAALTWITSCQAEPWRLYANLGLTLNRFSRQADRDTLRRLPWRASVATTYGINPQWKLVADTGLSQATQRTDHRAPAYLLAGAVFSPNADLDLDVGLRVGAGCAGCMDRIDRQIGVGATWRF